MLYAVCISSLFICQNPHIRGVVMRNVSKSAAVTVELAPASRHWLNTTRASPNAVGNQQPQVLGPFEVVSIYIEDVDRAVQASPLSRCGVEGPKEEEVRLGCVKKHCCSSSDVNDMYRRRPSQITLISSPSKTAALSAMTYPPPRLRFSARRTLEFP